MILVLVVVLSLLLIYVIYHLTQRRTRRLTIIFGSPIAEDSPSTGGISLMAVTINTNQKVAATAAFTDDEGNPTAAPGPISWSTSDPSVAVVDVNPDDDSQATIHTGSGVSTLGAAVITAESGGLVAEGAVEVIAAEASVSVIEFGTPEAEDAETPLEEQPPEEQPTE